MIENIENQLDQKTKCVTIKSGKIHSLFIEGLTLKITANPLLRERLGVL